MCAYQLASKVPAACLQLDLHGHTPIQLATASEKGEVRASSTAALQVWRAMGG